MNRTRTTSLRVALAALLALPVAPALAQAPAAAPPVSGAQTVQPATRESQALPSLAPLVESVKGAVVNVDVQSRPTRRGGRGGPHPWDQEEGGDDFFDRFFGGPGGARPQERVRQGAGSGFIIDPRGTLVTNNHVVEGAISIRIKLNDGRTFDGEVVGRDPLTDVAVVRLKGKVENLPSVKLGDSEALRVGDWVVAIGNPFGLASSVSAGILSAKAREIGASRFDDFLQTDAAINPGNSGGPLFNMRGEVVGMNTAIVGGGSGIGFAVPSNLIRALLPQLEKKGAVSRGWLGLGVQDLNATLSRALDLQVTEGAVVNQVTEGAPAQKAGLRLDDIIVAIDGDKIDSAGDLIRTVALKTPGSSVSLGILRGGKKQDLKVTLGTRPDLEKVGETLPAGDGEEQKSGQRVGVALRDLDPRMAQQAGFKVAKGALITEVNPGSPAERAELAPGMVVVEAGGKPVASAAELRRIINGAKQGTTLLLRVEGPSGARQLRAVELP